MMDKLRIQINASRNGEPYREIAKGIRKTDGSIDLPERSDDAAMLTRDLFDAFHRYIEEFNPHFPGTWTHHLGDTLFEINFTPF